MVRLTRLCIKQYLGVQGEVDLRFGTDHVFVVGPNGSGKSTLLDLIARLISGDLAPFRDERAEIDVEWEMEADLPNTVGLTARLVQRLRVNPHGLGAAAAMSGLAGPSLVAESGGAEWEYVAKLDYPRGVGQPCELRVGSAGAWFFDPPVIDRYLGGAWHDPLEPGFILVLEAVGLLAAVDADGPPAHDGLVYAPWVAAGLFTELRSEAYFGFKEALEGYHAIVADVSAVASIVRTEANGTFQRFVPGTLAPHVQGPPSSRTDEPEITVERQQAGAATDPARHPLSLLVDLLDAEAVTLRFRSTERRPGERAWRGFDLYVHWPGGVVHRHHQLSFGQKRLFAFLWYASVFSQVPLLTDELANGMHPAWVRRIAEILSGQQAIHALQNPLLLDWIGPGDPAEIPRQFVRCEVELVEGRRVWRWRNPTADESGRLHAAWSAGFQSLSAILESEGWL